MRYSSSISRRDAIRLGAGAGLALALDPIPALARQARPQEELIRKPIPSTGELLPVIGIGTARRYDVGTSAAERAPLRDVLRRFPELGGRLVDTAPSYGNAEEVVGGLVAEIGNRDDLFLATKISVREEEGREAAVREMEESFEALHTERVELLQIHNMNRVELLLPLLREWKQAGRIRYLGVTTSSDRQYPALLELMRREPLDFIQIDYSIGGREAADQILPLAAERGMGVLVNLPFGRSSVFEKVEGKPLPAWAAEIQSATWAQLFLKYVVSHPAVTAAIPGTAKMEYLLDNIGAARGTLPDAATRRRIEQLYDAL